jgi:hypothetical protein
MGIIADFIKHGGNITNPRVTYLCFIIVKIHFARHRNNFSTANTYLIQTRRSGQQQHLMKFGKDRNHTVRAQKKKSHRVPLHSSTEKNRKETWPFIPCRLSPPPLVAAGGTDIGTIMAFVGGWFEFKSNYLNIIKIKMTYQKKKSDRKHAFIFG